MIIECISKGRKNKTAYFTLKKFITNLDMKLLYPLKQNNVIGKNKLTITFISTNKPKDLT